MHKALERIADEFVGIEYEALSKAEKKVLEIALAALDRKLRLNEHGEVQFS